MKAYAIHSRLFLAVAASALILGGCAAPADRSAMTPQNLTVSKHYPHSLGIQTSGGAETNAIPGANISNADLKAAIEAAVSQSKLFNTVVQGSNGDYELSVRMTSLSKPLFGATFTVEMETAWSLTKTSDRSVAMRKAIKSSGSATIGDAIVGATRMRMAVEAASRNSIEQGLNSIAELNL